ncbi:MAG: NAD(P)H-dependent oxidoreductase [Planctomycetota bacterium]
MKILAIAASNSQTSINKKLVTFVSNRFKSEYKSEAEVEVIDLIDFEMPLYRPDREAEGGVPAPAQSFFDKIGATDVVFVSFAEHNGLYSAVYKNLFDWSSRIDQKVYQNKPMVLLSTSPGPRGASNVLQTATDSAPHFGMDVKGSVSIPSFQDNFDVDANNITNSELIAKVDEALKSLSESLG